MTLKPRSLRPSPATIISCIALFLALTGSAFAVGVAKNSVRSAQIANGTVRSVDLHRNAVNAAKIGPDQVGFEEIAADSVRSEEIAAGAVGSEEIAPDSVDSAKVAGDSLTADDVAPDAIGSGELQANSVHAGELGAVRVRTTGDTVLAGTYGGVVAKCLADERLLSGGGQSGHFGVEMTSSRPSGEGWLFQAKNNTAVDSTVTAYAVCLES